MCLLVELYSCKLGMFKTMYVDILRYSFSIKAPPTSRDDLVSSFSGIALSAWHSETSKVESTIEG